MAQPGRLSAVKVKALVRAGKPGRFGDGGNLYLQVSRYGGTTSWVFRYHDRADGDPHEMGLGPLHDFTLAEARARAREYRQQLRDGRDPLEERRAERARKALEAVTALTFRDCAERYIASHQAGWHNAIHAAQWPSTLNMYIYPIMGALPVAAIDTGLVMRAIEPIWAAKPETASRVRARVEAILGWAITRGYRPGPNPATWRGHLQNLLPKKSRVRQAQHFAAVPYRDVPALMTALRTHDGAVARALEFTVLTAARTSEVLSATWAEFEPLAERVWTVPPERMKARRQHRVPLSDAARAIIEDLAKVRHNEFVFPGAKAGRPLTQMVMLRLLHRLGYAATVHGLRSSFSDWVSERTIFPAEVREMALAHAVSDKVEAAYRRGDLFEKRRQLADGWARFCTMPAPGGRVVALRAAK